MANNLGSLIVSLGLDAAEFTRGMTKGEYEAKRATDNIKAQFASIATAVAGLGLGTLFVGGIRNALDYADQMGKLGQKAGITSEEFSGLAYAANAADVSNEQLAKGLRALTKDAGDGGKNLAALGISLDDASGKAKTADQLFSDVAARFERMPDGIQKTNLAIALFGEKVGPELIPLLNGGAEGIKAMTDEARELGKVIGDDVSKQADEFNDSLDRLKARADGFFIGVAGPIARGLNHVAEQFELARKYSGSFYESLFRTGTSNAPERIKDLQEKIKGLNAELNNPGLVGLPRARVEDAISAANKDLGLLNEFQRRAQLADNARLGEQFGKNNPKLNSLRARTETYVPLAMDPPKKDPRTGGPRVGKTEAEKAQEDYDAFQRRTEEDRVRYLERRWEDHERERVEISKRAQQDNDEIQRSTEEDRIRYLDRRWEEQERDRLDATKKAADAQAAQVERLGDAFSNTFDTAFREGMKVGDLIKKLAFDAINIQFLTPAAQKAGNWLGSAVSSLFSFDGGGYTGSGSRSGGIDGKGGFLSVLHPNETVLDHTKGQGMGGGATAVIQQTFNFGNASADTVAQLRAEAARIKAETLAAVPAAVLQARRTSTGFAAALRGA